MTSQFWGWDFIKEFVQEQHTVWKETAIPILPSYQWGQILVRPHIITWTYNQESQMMKSGADEREIIYLMEFSIQVYTFQLFYAVLQYCCAWILKPLIKI